MVPTATGFDHCELAGRNGAGLLQVLAGLETDNVQLPITSDRVPDHRPAEASATDVRCARNRFALAATLCTAAGAPP